MPTIKKLISQFISTFTTGSIITVGWTVMVHASVPERWSGFSVGVGGDFNHCTLKSNIGNYYQHVQCCTRGQATLDLCYSNVKEAYSAKPITKLGMSDQNTDPLYRGKNLSYLQSNIGVQKPSMSFKPL